LPTICSRWQTTLMSWARRIVNVVLCIARTTSRAHRSILTMNQNNTLSRYSDSPHRR
jgi:hypothetical protein